MNKKNISLANKWRPKNFKEFLGQNEIKNLIKKSIKYNKLHHSYLFFGPSGTGKTSFSRIFSKCLNCIKNNNYKICNKCKFCISLKKNKYIEDYIEINASSNKKLEKINFILKNVLFKPIYFKYKIYVIDEAHMLNNKSFNLILKVLEEPPNYVIFILITTNFEKIPETISSRCIILNFKPISIKIINLFISKILIKNKFYFNKNSLYFISLKSEGSLRKSVFILQKLLSFNKNFNLNFVKKHLFIINEIYLLKLIFYIFKNYNFYILKFFKNLKKINFPLKKFLFFFKNLLYDIFLSQFNPYNLIKFKNKKIIIFLSKLINPEIICLFYQISNKFYNIENINYNDLIFIFLKLSFLKINF